MSIATHIDKLRKASDECIDNGHPVRIPEAMSPGDMLPQGDIGLLMLSDQPSECVSVEWDGSADYQLAPGNTRGSRHTIPARFSRTVAIYRINDGDRLSDLVVVADAPFDLEHPEHADHVGYPPGVYRVRHQQNAQRERVLD